MFLALHAEDVTMEARRPQLRPGASRRRVDSQVYSRIVSETLCFESTNYLGLISTYLRDNTIVIRTSRSNIAFSKLGKARYVLEV